MGIFFNLSKETKLRIDPMMFLIANFCEIAFLSHLSCYSVSQPYGFGVKIVNGYIQTKNKMKVKQINNAKSKYQMSIDMVADILHIIILHILKIDELKKIRTSISFINDQTDTFE